MTIMKWFSLLTGFLFLACTSVYSQDLSLNELLDKYFKTGGMDIFQKSKSIILTGTLAQQDITPMMITRLRPNKYRMDFSVRDAPAIQAYDGQTAWWTMPWIGDNKPRVMPEETANELRIKSDFDGILFNWKAKGHVVELVGQEPMDTIRVYKIKVTRKDGGIEYYFIDTKKFLLQKRVSYLKQKNKEVEIENCFSDYRNIEGVLISFINKNKIAGRTISIVKYESVELGKPVDEKIFELPQLKQ